MGDHEPRLVWASPRPAPDRERAPAPGVWRINRTMRSDLTTFGLSLCLGLSALACDDKTPPPVDPEAATASGAEPAAAEESAEPSEEEKLAQQREQTATRLAEALERARTKSEEERKRWEEQGLEAKVEKLASTKHKSAKKALTKILASPHREPGNADRDPHRHPLETLTFFGITPKMTVIEAGPGQGWYTELLAPLLAKDGRLVVPVSDAKGPAYEFSTYLGQRLELMLGKSDALYGKVERVPNAKYEEPVLGAAGSADMVLVSREMHNWWRNGVWDAWVAACHAALVPGGTLAIVQHRAAEGANPDESAKAGYLPEKWLIEKIEGAGFELVEKSEINANPKDTKDYERGVWTLPPVLALQDKDKDKYVAIGESDRMTLKFEKKG